MFDRDVVPLLEAGVQMSGLAVVGPIRQQAARRQHGNKCFDEKMLKIKTTISLTRHQRRNKNGPNNAQAVNLFWRKEIKAVSAHGVSCCVYDEPSKNYVAPVWHHFIHVCLLRQSPTT